MRRTLTVLFTFAALIAVTYIHADAEVISQIRLKPMTKQQYLTMREMNLDLKQDLDGQIDVFAKPGDLARLQQAGIDYEIIHPDLQEFYLARNTDALSFGGFRTFSEIVDFLDILKITYPSLITDKFSIGLSWQGNDQFVVKISDNPDVDEDEPEVFYISLIHAREPASGAALLHFMEYLLSNYGVDPEVTEIVNNRELFFLPVQNPDGYLLNEALWPDGGGPWRKNTRDNGDGNYGVDVNRNYGFMWGYDNTGSSPLTESETYRGPGPFSEPEALNVRDFICARNFSIIQNVHCYSDLVIWPYSYDRIYSPGEDFYQDLGDSLTQYNGYDYEVGWALYPTNGGANDWAWGDTLSKPRTISITTEIGSQEDGFWPDPERIPTLCEDNVFPNFFLARIADNPYVIGPPKTPVITSPEVAGADFTVSWTLDDDANPGVTYRLIEYQGRAHVIDDAEADYGYWHYDRMELSDLRCHSGLYSWHSSNWWRSHHWLESETPYQVKSDDWLRFWLWYDLEEGFDYFYAQISTDGGYSFENLAGDLTTNSNPNNLNLGNGITGSSGDWVYAAFDLSAYEGQYVIVRLAYFTDEYITMGEGVYIDDIENIDIFNTETELSSTITETSYDLTSKADDVYWYRVSATDAQGQESRLSALTSTTVATVECCLINGDVNGNGQLNSADLMYYVGWLWHGGGAPPCLEQADIDGDLELDQDDLFYLVDYFWKHGPAPAICHRL